jgi:hypothetical protein
MARKMKLPEWERLTCYLNKGRDLYFLDAEALEEDRKEDPRLHQKLGISRQMLWSYCNGKAAPKVDRLPLFVKHTSAVVWAGSTEQ